MAGTTIIGPNIPDSHRLKTLTLHEHLQNMVYRNNTIITTDQIANQEETMYLSFCSFCSLVWPGRSGFGPILRSKP